MSKERQLLNPAKIGQSFETEIRDAFREGQDLTRITPELQAIMGLTFTDPRAITFQMFAAALERDVMSLDLNFKSLETVADGLFLHALKYISTQSRFVSLQNHDQRELLAAYWATETWWNIYFLAEMPLLLANAAQKINWPETNAIYLGRPARPAKYTSRSQEYYVHPEGVSLFEVVEKLIAEANGEPVKVTDVGMGEGTLVRNLKTTFGDLVEVTGVTLNNVSVPGVKVIVAPAEFINDIPTASQDLIVSNYASGYFLWPARAYQEMVRILKPGRSGLLDIARNSRGHDELTYRFMSYVLAIPEENVAAIMKAEFRAVKSLGTVNDLFEKHIAAQTNSRLLVKPAINRDAWDERIELVKLA